MSVAVRLVSEELVLLAERAMLWPRKRTLLVADLHWGKRETFVLEGIPLPDGLLADELSRLTTLVERYDVARIVVLGDLIHSREGITAPVRERIASFRVGGPSMTLVRGNHDRHLARLPPEWLIEEHDELVEAPFLFAHVPRRDPKGYVLAGHVHPALRLRGRGDGLRVPCFHVTDGYAVLPAFSEFTGGAVIRPRTGERVFAIAGDRVVEV